VLPQLKKKKSKPAKRSAKSLRADKPGNYSKTCRATGSPARPGGVPGTANKLTKTLKTYLIEEAYEVLDALEDGGPDELTEESAISSSKILFHSDIAKEPERFDIADVISGIHEKMVRRHPHVFGSVKADTPQQVLKNGRSLKAQEKRERALGCGQSTVTAARNSSPAPPVLRPRSRAFLAVSPPSSKAYH